MTLVNVHDKLDCIGEWCCIHNPSDHALKDARLNWRQDRGLMERLCEHGIGHPDPDDLEYKRRSRGMGFSSAFAIHGCDGCCFGDKGDK